MKTNFSDYLVQGKSNNFFIAKENGKITAGEAAKILSKKFKIKILARDIDNLTDEFHHAGVFKNHQNRLTGKKVKFFTLESVNSLTLNQILDNKNQKNSIVKGWYITFKKVSINRYGKLAWKPFVSIYKGQQQSKPQHFHELSDIDFDHAKQFDNKQLKSFANHYTDII